MRDPPTGYRRAAWRSAPHAHPAIVVRVQPGGHRHRERLPRRRARRRAAQARAGVAVGEDRGAVKGLAEGRRVSHGHVPVEAKVVQQSLAWHVHARREGVRCSAAGWRAGVTGRGGRGAGGTGGPAHPPRPARPPLSRAGPPLPARPRSAPSAPPRRPAPGGAGGRRTIIASLLPGGTAGSGTPPWLGAAIEKYLSHDRMSSKRSGSRSRKARPEASRATESAQRPLGAGRAAGRGRGRGRGRGWQEGQEGQGVRRLQILLAWQMHWRGKSLGAAPPEHRRQERVGHGAQGAPRRRQQPAAHVQVDHV
jgi:hypothetical protein